MIKVNHEVPKCLLYDSRIFNEYDFCLPHLLDKDEKYKEYFYNAKEIGRYVIMDNSLHELGEAYDHKRLLYWVNELKPNEFIVPDVWEDKIGTLVNAKHFLQYEYPEETTLMAVVQGKTYAEMYECYYLLKNLGYKKIAFSYGGSVYNDISGMEGIKGKARGRVSLIFDLYEKGIIIKTDRIHLLGCAVPQEFLWYKDLPFIESLDTSNPIMAAIDGMKYGVDGLQEKPQANINNSFDIDFFGINHELINYNTQKFREINRL